MNVYITHIIYYTKNLIISKNIYKKNVSKSIKILYLYHTHFIYYFILV